MTASASCRTRAHVLTVASTHARPRACDARRSILPSKPVALATLSSDLNMVVFFFFFHYKNASRLPRFLFGDVCSRVSTVFVQTLSWCRVAIFPRRVVLKINAEEFHFLLGITLLLSLPAGQSRISVTSEYVKGTLAHFFLLPSSSEPLTLGVFPFIIIITFTLEGGNSHSCPTNHYRN